MVEILFPQKSFSTNKPADLLNQGEVVAIVDDSPEIVILLSHYLNNQGFHVVQAGSAEELYTLLKTHNIALVLLDIGLPDKNGNEILSDLAPAYPDLGIIMVTGTTDIEVALECLRQGADDYLIKPVPISQFYHTVENTLKKRRLVIANRIFQKELQITNGRMRFLHHLNLKMNTAYLNTFELNAILQAILVGITSDEGLRFNRAFLALFDEKAEFLEGKLAIGPASREEAGKIWDSIKQEGLQLDDILKTINDDNDSNLAVNEIIQSLKIPVEEQSHVLIHATRTKEAICVHNGTAKDCRVPHDLLNTLQETSFVVVPLYSPTKSLGVIIVDNFVTGRPISTGDINDLEIFASQASLAIEHSHLYEGMSEKIEELELVTQELNRNKDLLLEAERTSTIGQMSAQLLHAIRNPLTSIGGTSRLLSRKSGDQYFKNFLSIITEEASKIETILDDLFSFVDDSELSLEPHCLYALVRKCVMVFYNTMKENNIEYNLLLDGTGPLIPLDENKARQMFLHLIRNSVEAMTTGGILKIEAIDAPHSVTIEIIDTGPGIPQEALPHVTDPFFTTKTYGNGIGLALVDKVVSGHGGKLNLRHNQPGGTIASVQLPKSPPSK